ncbi:MAG: choice-of-anchor D domain-containing protein [Myxococcota bacterium]|nr:choice-of-anchor D domain-containing protein [Myxococcota bacterium]
MLKHTRTHILCFFLFASFLAACDDDQFSASYPEIEVLPNPVTLTAVEVGEETSRTLTLRNSGSSQLIVTEISFSEFINQDEFTIEHPPLPITLEGQEELSLRLRYSPVDVGIDQGFLIFTSNDRTNGQLRVPINSTLSATGLTANPDRLAFFSEDGSRQFETVDIINLGTVPVTINSWALSDDSSADFEIVTPSAQALLGQDDVLSVEVAFQPSDSADDFGTLTFETDSQIQPRLNIQLVGATPSPEIVVLPESVEFGAIDLNTESEPVEIIIENRGTQPLTVSNILLAPATPPPNNEQFNLSGLPDFAQGPLTIEPDAAASFTVNYLPQVEGRHATSIVIENNDVDESIFTVPLTGRVRQPCIEVLPDAIDFGFVARGIESARQVANVLNCGDMPLVVEDISIDNGDFNWAPTNNGPRTNVTLEPLETMVFETWFQNNSTAEGQPASGTLTVRNNTPDRPAVEVPLTATGGGQPNCTLTILPRRMDFGLVARGSNTTRDFDILNRGTGHCDITNQEIVPLIDIPIPGFNMVRFSITQRAPNGRIGPGATVPMQVTYRPQIYGADLAKLRISFNDPFTNEARTVEADLSGLGGDSNISVIPSRLDFGAVTAGECASREERVSVYNTGLVNLCITDMRLEGPDCAEFLITDRPVANQDGCILVTRNRPAEVLLQYEPTNLAEDNCELVFVSDANNAPELRVPLVGEGVATNRQTDDFVQTSGQRVDVLFVIDNSGSMGEEQDNLQDNFASFINGARQFANDYQIGVVTTDVDDADNAGKLVGDPRIIRRGPDVENQFSGNVAVGTRGSGTEKGLEAAEKALKDPLIFDTGVACQANADCVEPDRCVEGRCGGFNRGFLREDAALEIVFVSDEDDSSSATLNYYVDFFKNIKGFRNESLFHAHAIVGADNGRPANCNSNLGDATPGRAYVEVANRTNGGIYSICEGDFGRALREIGNQAFGLPVQFFLSRPAREASIRVSVNGAPRANGWSYDRDSNSVIFDEASVPQPRESIRVEYDAQCFPRRN